MKFSKAIKLHKNWSLIKIWWTKKWIIDKSFIYYIDREKKTYFVEIEKWFETDFWSIPKILQNIFSPTKYISYLLHDKLYNSPIIFNWITEKFITRKQVDQILIAWLNIEWANFLEKICIYIWVRIWGWLFFNKK